MRNEKHPTELEPKISISDKIKKTIKGFHPDRYMQAGSEVHEKLNEFTNILIQIKKFCDLYTIEALESWRDLEINADSVIVSVPEKNKGGELIFNQQSFSTPKDLLRAVHILPQKTKSDMARELRMQRTPDASEKVNDDNTEHTSSKPPSPFNFGRK